MDTHFSEWESAFIRDGRVGRFATVDGTGRPHVLPIVYAFDGALLYTPLDGKPKRVALDRLQRVRNISANAAVALVVDHYDEDWNQLAWVQIRGRAELVSEGERYDAGMGLLGAKYPQYTTVPLAGRPLIVIIPDSVRSWRASGRDAMHGVSTG